MTDVVAAYEPAEHVMFGGQSSGPYETAPREKGEHGFWPGRADYRSIYLLWGPGVRQAALPELSMLDLKDRLALAVGIACGR